MSDQFKLGDKVRVEGYGGYIFQIVTIESVFDHMSGYKDIIYTIQNTSTGEVLEAFAEDMILHEKSLSYQEMIQVEKEKREDMDQRDHKAKKVIEKMNHSRNLYYGNFNSVDEALDMINDLNVLRDLFNDKQYEHKVEKVISGLKESLGLKN